MVSDLAKDQISGVQGPVCSGGKGGGFGSGCSGGDPIKVVLFPPLLWICLAKIAQL